VLYKARPFSAYVEIRTRIAVEWVPFDKKNVEYNRLTLLSVEGENSVMIYRDKGRCLQYAYMHSVLKRSISADLPRTFRLHGWSLVQSEKVRVRPMNATTRENVRQLIKLKSKDSAASTNSL